MTKYTKFMVNSYGDLIYKKTGNYVNKNYTVQGNRVYYKGRLKGYISKPTKKEAERYIKKMNRRLNESNILLKKPNAGGLDVKDVREIKEMVDIGTFDHPLDKAQKEFFNFATHLNDMMESGYISEKTANAWLDEYKRARTPEERTKVWRKLKALQKDVGYEGSPI